MAIKIFEKYGPTRANAPTTGYPEGSLKNESVPGANDGTPLDQDWGNDYAGFDAALFSDTGVTPNGNPDSATESQRLVALSTLIGDKSGYTFNDRSDMVSNASTRLSLKLGLILKTKSAFGTDHGGWAYVVTNDVANGLNKLNLGDGFVATAMITGGIIPAGAYGATLDNVTDDAAALTELHNDSISYSLDGRRAYCTVTLEPKTGQTIYPFGGGIRKDTVGYMFSRNGPTDRFIIEKGGLFLGDNVADFCEMDGAFGFGNAWHNCEINAVCSGFVKAFRMSNARRCTIKGRYGCREAVDYVNKSAECDIQFANFIRSGTLAGTRGIRCADEGDGYPEGLVFSGGMLFDFSKNMDLDEFFEINFLAVECAASSGTYASDGHQIDVKARTGGFARGLYFDAHCHFSARGILFGDGTDVSPHNYDCVLDGYFRSQAGGETIRIDVFQHDIHIKDGTIFRGDGSPGTRIAVVGVNQNQGITVGGIKCYGYDSYVQFKQTGAKNNVRDIPNMSDVTPNPVFFEYAVDYNNIQGISNIRAAEKIDPVVVAATDIIKTVTLDLGEGTYLLRSTLTVSTVTTPGTLQLGITPTGGGTFDLAGGGGWSSTFRTLASGEGHFDKVTVVTVTKGGEFTVNINSQSAAFTTNGFHDFLSVERV